MRKCAFFFLFLLFLPMITSAQEQPPSIQVGEIDMPPLKWGEQEMTFELINYTDYLKFIVTKVEINFTGSYLNPTRTTSTYDYLYPMETKIFTPSFKIPYNFGRAEVKVTLYDVVDTLDIILPGQKFFEQVFWLTVNIPEAMHPYLSERITMPPMVDVHPDFDNEFSRIFLQLLQEGRSLGEIAYMSKTDTVIINEMLTSLIEKHYIKIGENGIELTFPFISIAEAEDTKVLAEKLSDTLSSRLERTLSRYPDFLDSLVAAGVITSDSDAFYDGGSVLYRPYPFIGALILWWDLGQKFITRSAPLLIYDNTDLCKAHIPFYMYAVQGGDVFNGSNFYALSFYGASYLILWGDEIPRMRWVDHDYTRKQISWSANVKYQLEYNPEMFMTDTSVVRAVSATMLPGAEQFLTQAYQELFQIVDKHGHYKVLFGHRYWFWNLVATRTMTKLTRKGLITRRGNGQFKFEGMLNP